MLSKYSITSVFGTLV